MRGDSFYLFLLVVELLIVCISSKGVTGELSLFFMRITRSEKASVMIMALLFLPGVIVHEFAHYIVAVLLSVHVEHMEFFPKVNGNTIKLGSVSIHKTDPVRRFFIGVAPLITGVVVLYAIFLFYFSSHMFLNWKTGVVLYILFEIGNTMFSSKKDMEGSIIILILACCLTILIFLFSPSLFFTLSTFILQFSGYAERADYMLFIVVIVNIAVYSSLRFLRKRR